MKPWQWKIAPSLKNVRHLQDARTEYLYFETPPLELLFAALPPVEGKGRSILTISSQDDLKYLRHPRSLFGTSLYMACDFNLPIPAAPICWQPAWTFFLSSRSLVFVITSSHAYVDFRERPECLGWHHVSGAENRMHRKPWKPWLSSEAGFSVHAFGADLSPNFQRFFVGWDAALMKIEDVWSGCWPWSWSFHRWL